MPVHKSPWRSHTTMYGLTQNTGVYVFFSSVLVQGQAGDEQVSVLHQQQEKELIHVSPAYSSKRSLLSYRTWQILTIGTRTLMEGCLHAIVVVRLLKERKRSVYNGTRAVDSVMERYWIT